MLIPLRAGDEGLILSWDLEEVVGVLRDPNLEFERLWAGLLTVMRDSWPDWPIEVWAAVDDASGDSERDFGAAFGEEDDEEVDADLPPAEQDGAASPFRVKFALFFGGDGRDSMTGAAMASFAIAAIARALPVEPVADWGHISPDWKPLWVVDDEVIYRLYAPEATIDSAMYLLGSYAGLPTWFAASEEAWPLHQAYAQLGIELADADTSWAFDL
jgi:hypothetical protein